jgi:6-phosphogluconate dehydrogenase
LGLQPQDLAAIFEQWNQEELNSFLIEITSKIFRRLDDKTGQPLVDLILDKAKQKGTGMWTTEEALHLQVGTPTIDMAVVMRDLSGFKSEREAAAQVLARPQIAFTGDRQLFIRRLKNALFAGLIATYAQGMALLKKASETYGYGLNLAAVARIWRGGCIIRSALLEHIRSAFLAQADLPNLLLDPHLRQEFLSREDDLRQVVIVAAGLGLPAAALMATLAYIIAYRSAQLPANLIQAQRDYFGAHTYERVDAPGTFHTQWDQD